MLPCLLSLLDYSDFEEYSTTWTFNANIICNNLGGQKQNKKPNKTIFFTFMECGFKYAI